MYAAIETSFDEAGIAVCHSDGTTATSLLTSQVELHAPYGGCVPELAARTHLSDLPQMWHKLDPAITAKITHIGVTAGPGLPGCLLAGVNFARGAARALRLPLYGLNHLTGHVFSPFMPAPATGESIHFRFPHLALLISGGHTELYLVKSLTGIELLGQTRDDAVGELLDKVSAMLQLGYPGGAKLEQLANEYPGFSQMLPYDGEYRLPVPMRGSGDLDFSYSGLKTAVVKIVRSPGSGNQQPLPLEQQISLLAALFEVVAESLWLKIKQAVDQYNPQLVTVSGGVAINQYLRRYFEANAAKLGVELAFPANRHCLDNAEMMAWLLKLVVDEGIAPDRFDVNSNWNPGT